MQIKDICEITGKTREEVEEMLKKEDIIELKLTEKVRHWLLNDRGNKLKNA